MKTCCKCLETIGENERISFLSNKYKVCGEEVCKSCVDLEIYKLEKSLDLEEPNDNR